MKLLVAGIVLLAFPTLALGKPLEAVAFDMEPFELAQTHELTALLAAQSASLRRALAEKGLRIVDTRSKASEIADHQPLSACDGCDLAFARAFGADLVVTTTVQEIEYPVYSLFATVRDAETGRVLRKAVANVAGLDAKDWDEGVATLVKERLLAQPLPADAAGLRELVARSPLPPE